MPAHKKTKAIILRRTDFGEADRIVSALTPEGKISFIARGARRQKSKLASGIELLSENEVNYIEGKSELFTLVSSRPLHHWQNLLSDYDRLQIAYKLLKYMNRVSDLHGDASLYGVLSAALSALNESDEFAGVAETWFYLQCLAGSGHTPELNRDEDNKPLDESYNYDLSTDTGLLSRGSTLSSDHIKVWRLALTKPLDVIVKVKGVPRAAEQSRTVIEQFFNYHL